jgi:hypothetical protein
MSPKGSFDSVGGFASESANYAQDDREQGRVRIECRGRQEEAHPAASVTSFYNLLLFLTARGGLRWRAAR